MPDPDGERYNALVIDGIRREIEANDAKIVSLVNNRVKFVEKLWRFKRRWDMPLGDTHREDVLTTILLRSNRGPLDPEGVRSLTSFLFALTKRIASEGK